MKKTRLMIGIFVLALLAGSASVDLGRGASAAALETPTPTPEPSNLGRVTAYGLNVRTGPGTAYPLKNGGGLRLGDVVEVVGKNAAGPSINSGHSHWLQIVYPSTALRRSSSRAGSRGSGQGSGPRPTDAEGGVLSLSKGRAWVAAAYVAPAKDGEWRMETLPEVSAPPPPSPRPNKLGTLPTGTPELTGKLVFQVCNGCDIYVINADGSGLRRLTDGMDPAWSPDGKKVAFARWRDPRGIYIIDEDGSNETLLFGWSEAKAPAWSPDGSHIVFTRHKPGGREEDIKISASWTLPAHPWWKLGLVRVEDRYFTELLCYDHSFSPTWSPDPSTGSGQGGKVIAYDSDYGPHLTATDGSIGGQFYDRSLYALSTDVHDTSPAWSPDGTKIAFMFNQHDHWEIYVMNADGANRVRLTKEEPFTPRPPNNVSPAWSPDGRHIAFFTDRNSELRWELYVMNADGSNQRPMLVLSTVEGFETALDGLPIEYGFVAERMVSWTE